MVHQHGQGIFYLFQGGAFRILIAILIDDGYNGSLGHQEPGHAYTCIQKSAGITTQIQNQGLHALLLQLLVFLSKILHCAFVKNSNANIADFGIGHKLPAHGRIFDILTNNAHLAQAAILALQLQQHLRALLTTDFLCYLLHIQRASCYIIHRSNNIATFYACQSAGVIGQGRDNYIIITALAKNNANPAKGTVGHMV